MPLKIEERIVENMLNKNRIINNIINAVVFCICLSIVALGSNITNNLENSKASIKANIEKEWRQQAKRTLANIQDNLMYDMNHGVVDPLNEYSLQNWAKRNLSGVLNGGQTGDAFMINLGDEQFIWDGSPDCAKPEFITNGRYMKDEADMHYDKEQARIILDKIRLAQSTLNTEDNYWWNFDGNPEYLEWIVIPPGTLGFDYESYTVGGVKNPNYNKILIALGTQQDEIESTFSNDFTTIDKTINEVHIFIVASILICFFNMVIYIYLNKKTN